MEFVFKMRDDLEIRDTYPDFEGHGLSPMLKDGEVIAYAGRRWLLRREPGETETFICTPVDEGG